MNFWLQSLSADFLQRVRDTGTDAQGQAVQYLRATGGEPCRDILRRAKPGEEIILASFSPFSRSGPFREFGPVYIMAAESTEDIQRNVLPLPDGSDTAYFGEQFVLRAYNEDDAIIGATLVTAAIAHETLANYLDRDEVAFVDARFATYGCFACRIARQPGTVPSG
jgi:hypothetical protein